MVMFAGDLVNNIDASDPVRELSCLFESCHEYPEPILNFGSSGFHNTFENTRTAFEENMPFLEAIGGKKW